MANIANNVIKVTRFITLVIFDFTYLLFLFSILYTVAHCTLAACVQFAMHRTNIRIF